MRYLPIALAALGFLGAGDASSLCKPSGSEQSDASTSPRVNIEGSSTPATTPVTPIPTSSATPRNHLENGDFKDGLANYHHSGDVTLVPGVGIDGGHAISLSAEGDVLRKRAQGNSGVSTTVTGLKSGTTYTILFYYAVVYNKVANTCRIGAYWNSDNYFNTDYFTQVGTASSITYTAQSNSIRATSSSATLQFSLSCKTGGSAQVYIGSISVTAGTNTQKTTAKTTSTRKTTAKTTSTQKTTAKTTSTQKTTAKTTNTQKPSTTQKTSTSVATSTGAQSTTQADKNEVTSSAESTVPSSTDASSDEELSSTATAEETTAESTTGTSTEGATENSTAESATTELSTSESSDASSTQTTTEPESSATTVTENKVTSTEKTTTEEATSNSATSTETTEKSTQTLESSVESSVDSNETTAESSTKPTESATETLTETSATETPTKTSAETTSASAASSGPASSTPSASTTKSSATETASESTSESAGFNAEATPSAAASTTGSALTTNSSSTVSASATPSSTPSSTTSSSSGAATVDTTILVIAADSDTASAGSLGLLGYGIPYEYLIVPQEGVDLPKLNSSSTHGNYGGIIVMDSVAYEYSSGWNSAITSDQWEALYAYQVDFNVRMVRINEYPGSSFGTTTTSGGGCCDTGVEQNVSFTDTSDFPSANIKANAEVSTSGLWHVPAVITDSSTTKEVAKFGTATGFSSDTVAAVINNFDGREQFVWFIGWAPSWSLTSSYLEHGHIHWLTRGVFLGKRKIHINCQIDDVQLATELYYPADEDDFKIEIDDLESHITWQNSINSRMPAGSDFRLELGHNGNGDLISSTLEDDNSICDPEDAVYYDSPDATDLEFMKVRGTGVDIWPSGYEVYSWDKSCASLDDFASWFMVAENRDQFAHVSHTFTHLSLNNATYHDAAREIKFNQEWLAQTGIDQATYYSPNGLIPPAITGMHNGDAIQAWMDNGIYHVVGDNTRPVLRNTDNPYWPLISTVASNGYDGLTIVPRWSTAIYFNCATSQCTLNEWIATSAGSGDYFDLLANSKASNVRNLLALQADGFMFHQANMHQTTVDTITIGDQTGKMSLVMSWTETMVQEMMRLTNWPMTSLKHDDLAQYFLDRKTVDDCNPKLSYTFSKNGTSIESVTVTADSNTCDKPIPVTIPSGSVSASGGSVSADVVGSEPPIQWVTLSGSPVTLKLSSPVSLS